MASAEISLSSGKLQSNWRPLSWCNRFFHNGKQATHREEPGAINHVGGQKRKGNADTSNGAQRRGSQVTVTNGGYGGSGAMLLKLTYSASGESSTLHCEDN